MLPRGSYFRMGRQGRLQQCFDDGGKAICHRTSMGGLVDKCAAMARAVHVLNELFTLCNCVMARNCVPCPKSALKRVVRAVAGKEKVAAFLNKELDLFECKNPLVAQTFGGHTTLIELTRNSGRESALPSGPSLPTRWTVCNHDSMCAHSVWDTALRKGMAIHFEGTGLKNSNFSNTFPAGLVQQKDSIVYTLMAFIRLVERLTGEKLDAEHWEKLEAVELVRVFFDLWLFDLWLFRHAECAEAIRRGYLQRLWPIGGLQYLSSRVESHEPADACRND
jgi:hypothetical protein